MRCFAIFQSSIETAALHYIGTHVGVQVPARVDVSGRVVEVDLLDLLTVAQVRMDPDQSLAIQQELMKAWNASTGSAT